MSPKNRKHRFTRRKKIKNPFFTKLGSPYQPTEEDLAIAVDKELNPVRFSELVKLNSITLSRALLIGNQLNLEQQITVIQNIFNMPKNVVSISEKSQITNELYNQLTSRGINSSYLRSLFKYILEQQSKDALEILRIRSHELTASLDRSSKQNLGTASGRVKSIRKSKMWDEQIKTFLNSDLYWEIMRNLHYSRLEPASSSSKEINLKTLKLLDETIKFKENSEIGEKYDASIDANPVYFLSILKARIVYRTRKGLLESMLDDIFTKSTEILDAIKIANSILQKEKALERARINARKAAEIAAEEERIAKIELIKNELIEYRAVGFVNAENEFDSFLKELRFVDGEEWDIDKLAAFLSKDFIFNLERDGFQTFLNKSIRTISQPLVAYISNGATLELTTDDDSIFKFSFKTHTYGQTSLELQIVKPRELNDPEKNWYSRYFRSNQINQFLYTSPWAQKRSLEYFLQEKDISIKSAKFIRQASDIDFLDLIAFVYQEPNFRETVRLYFHNWQFFTDGYPCDRCGKPLTHGISAVKGVGPVCGDHSYSLESSDARRIEKHLSRLPKARLLRNDSPIIQSRVEFFSRISFSEENILNALKSNQELSYAQRVALIESAIHERYFPVKVPKVAWGSKIRTRRSRR